MTVMDMHDFLDVFQGPDIDDIEADLKALGREDLANALNRLSMDAAIHFMTLKTGGFDAGSGPETARRYRDYKPLTLERLTLLDRIRPLFPDHQMLTMLCESLSELNSRQALQSVSEKHSPKIV